MAPLPHEELTVYKLCVFLEQWDGDTRVSSLRLVLNAGTQEEFVLEWPGKARTKTLPTLPAPPWGDDE